MTKMIKSKMSYFPDIETFGGNLFPNLKNEEEFSEKWLRILSILSWKDFIQYYESQLSKLNIQEFPTNLIYLAVKFGF